MADVNPTSQVAARDDRAGELRVPQDESSDPSGGLAVPDWVILLAANWKVLLAGVVVATVIAAVPQLLAPRQYIAESLIAPTVSWTQVQFEPKIKTVDSNSAQPQTGAITPERRQALVDLIRSSTIERAVLTELSGALPDTQLQPGAIAGHISGGLKPRSEILGIQAVADTPETAVLLAGAWARAYVDNVNRVYTPPDADSSIGQLRDQAQAQLQKAQDALTASLRDSRLEALDREINDDEQTLRLLRTPYQTPNPNPAGTIAGPQQNGASPSVDSSTAMLNDYRLAERRTLDDIAQTLRRLDATRESVRALINQAASDANGSASAAAVSLVKAQLVSISGGLPSQMQFQLPVSDVGASQAELQALVASIEHARTEVAAEFDRRRQAYEANRDQQIATLEKQLQDLRSQREQADAERKQLTSQRDLAADTYNALARKSEETRVAQGTQGREVVLASEATFAVAAPRLSIVSLSGAALVGLILAIALVVLVSLNSLTRANSTGQIARAIPLRPATSGADERRIREATSS